MFSHGLHYITLSLLMGCAVSATHTPSPQGNLPQATESKSILTEQILSGSGLIIEGRSSYDMQMEKELQRFASHKEAVQQYPRRYPLFTFFKTFDDSFIRDQVADIHQFILPLLAAKIEQSPLKFEKWNNEYRLSFNIWSLHFDLEQEAKADWQQAICWTEIGVTLHHIPDNNIVFAQKPNLIILVKKKTPSSKQTLNALYAESAQQIFQVLSDYWTNKGTMKVEN